MKTIEELRKMDTGKLLQELEEAMQEGFKVSFAVRNGQANNTDKIKKYRRYVAVIKTVIKEKPQGGIRNSEENLEKEA